MTTTGIPSASGLPDDEELAGIETLFANGNFEATTRKVNEALVRDFDLPPSTRAAIYLMKARLELAFDRPNEIELWLTKAFQTEPTLELDPVKDPPKLIEVYDRIRGKTPKDSDKGAKSETVDLHRGHPYWRGLMPFGFGHFHSDLHRDGTLFLSSELLSLLATATLPKPKNGARGAEQAVFGISTFAGIYGYELLDMTHVLASNDPGNTATLRYALSYFPFGVAQAKNRQTLKAWTFAATEAALIGAAVFAPLRVQRQVALGLFVSTVGYGIYDGLDNHSDSLAAIETPEQDFAFQLLPILGNGRSGAIAQVTWRR